MLLKVFRGAVACPLNGAWAGMWHAMCKWIEGRQARLFERERRATLELIPGALPPGTTITDRRADGSVLDVRIPPVLLMPYMADQLRADVHQEGPEMRSSGIPLP